MAEIEQKLRNTDFFFETLKGTKKGDGKWSDEAQDALQKAISQGHTLLTSATSLLKNTVGLKDIEKVAENDLKIEIKKLQSIIANMQTAIMDGLNMEEGKKLMADFVEKTEDP